MIPVLKAMGGVRHGTAMAAVGLTLLLAGSIGAQAEELAESPEETLRAYLTAMKAMNFEKVYDLSTKAAAQGKDRATWATEMRYQFQLAEAKIFNFKVFPAKVQEGRALVPNILTSQDKYLNQLAAPEYELYTLLKEEGRWKVDRQTIVDFDDLPKWFPGI